ncbi:hypothetical protein [Shewanella sp. OMA3-2]|uniref:hypothetical protein n=1 Tax=Shewanella sp. OMA3-2 TaxID=2908650 RepID=UPI001F3A6779|nr:hypothetical protein [Shewanella sp. OMA3-2]UJF20502.1 hypothetical protein L0B17_09750 [Shewanella sp. OMA3-2]
MTKSKFSNALWFFPFFLVASCSASQLDKAEIIFKCHADQPKSIDVVISKMDNSFKLAQFNIENSKFANAALISDVSKSSYHRSLVTEHSMTFTHGDSEVIVSDYYSEELNMITKETSVTIQKNGKKEYWLCDESGFSQLGSIEDF